MNIYTNFSEKPEYDLWQQLLHFSYNANIEKYFLSHNIEYDNSIIEIISGSILQANSYFNTSITSGIQISPLLLYYGSTNILNAVSLLLTGRKQEIHNHGMKKTIPEDYCFISDTAIRFEDTDYGSINVFCRALNIDVDFPQTGEWRLKELLSSIAEINRDYIDCYSERKSNVLPLEGYETPEGKLYRIYFDNLSKEEFFEMFEKVPNSNVDFLRPQIAKCGSEHREYIVLRNKINKKPKIEVSFSGQPYLQVGHIKNGKLITIPSLMYMHIVLFTLGSLCRYNPGEWNQFVKYDKTGEKLLIEKLLYYARRLIPNYALNTILGGDYVFSCRGYSDIDTVKFVGKHEIQEIVSNELYRQKRGEF